MKSKQFYIINILILFIYSCTFLNQNIFIKDQKIGNDIIQGNSKYSVRYKLYQTGFDNFKYEFYAIKNTDTLVLFNSNLNDASYKKVEFSLEEKNGIVFIFSNYNLGKIEKIQGEFKYVLSYK